MSNIGGGDGDSGERPVIQLYQLVMREEDTQLQQKKGCCERCLFWVEFNENTNSEPEGECHRLPPQVTATGTVREQHYGCSWPITGAADWCGEFDEAVRMN
jgi:hypothetical protein